MKKLIENLIAKGETELAIKQILLATKQVDKLGLREEVILQSSRFQTICKRRDLGVCSSEEFDLGVNRINLALLNIITQFPSDGVEIEIKKNKSSIENPYPFVHLFSRDIMILINFLLLIIIVGLIYLRYNNSYNHKINAELDILDKQKDIFTTSCLQPKRDTLEESKENNIKEEEPHKTKNLNKLQSRKKIELATAVEEEFIDKVEKPKVLLLNKELEVLDLLIKLDVDSAYVKDIGGFNLSGLSQVQRVVQVKKGKNIIYFFRNGYEYLIFTDTIDQDSMELVGGPNIPLLLP